MKRAVLVVVALVVLVGAGIWYYIRPTHTRLTLTPASIAVGNGNQKLKAPAHVVIVIDENKSYEDILGSKNAPYINSLISKGALLTHSYGVAHPSQPNYLALFSGQTNKDGDSCKVAGIDPGSPSLGGELIKAHKSFTGFSEDLPSPGFAGCYSGQYARKHSPWTHFTDVPAGSNQPLSALRLDKLPDVALIIPNLQDDMHSASVARGDAWLKTHIDPIIKAGAKNNTLFILTFDENDGARGNHILTVFVGPMVKAGTKYDAPVNHFSVLRTLENFYHLRALGASATAQPVDITH